jgi:hypothetical protein
MASIGWTDSTGAATLTNLYATGPASRFANWTPDTAIVAQSANAMADGALHVFEFRADYLVSFELRDIPEASHALMMRLSRHLQRGGSVTVTTGDAASHVYTCTLAPGAERPRPEMTDERDRFYRLSFTLLNTVQADMELSY